MARPAALQNLRSPVAGGANTSAGKLVKKILTMQRRGAMAESLPICKKVAQMGVTTPEFLQVYAIAMSESGNPNQGLVLINAALKQRPEDAGLLNTMGEVLLKMNDRETAIAAFKKATAIDQNHVAAWLNLGNALRLVERYQAAVIALNCAHHLDPNRSDALINLSFIYAEQRLYKKSAQVLDRVIAREKKPDAQILLTRMKIARRLEDVDYITEHYPTFDRSSLTKDQRAALDSLWVYVLVATGRREEAISLLKPWTAVQTSSWEVMMSHLGWLYSESGEAEKGIALQCEVLDKNPDNALVRYNLAHMQMANGQLTEGFANYEARWLYKEFPSDRRRFDAPRWEGQPLEGKSILVWPEQGVGDEIRFASLIPELKNSGADVTVECKPKLRLLWEEAFPWAKIVRKGPIECRGDEAYAHFDYQIPLGSLAGILRPTIETFSERQKPWIGRSPEAERGVRQQIVSSPDDFVVGICWRSSNRLISREQYFLALEELEPLKSLGGCQWLSLQYDGEDDEIERIRELGLPIHHFPDIDQKNDLVAASHLIGACDLVVSVGVSVADLAGGLGVPLLQIGKKSSEVYLGAEHPPWFPFCRSVRIGPGEAGKGIKAIVDGWSDHAAWARAINAANG